MKRALVFSLIFAIGLGIGVAAQSFSGMWSTDIALTIGAAPPYSLNVAGLTSVLSVDYTISGWTFGFNGFIDMTELFGLNFDIAGVLGAFSVYSFLDFDPTDPSFTSWENVGTLSLAGVNLYGVFVLQDLTVGGIGTGWAIGGYGTAGDVEVWVEADFNLSGKAATLFTYGFGYATDWGTYWDCDEQDWLSGAWSVQTDSCTPAFSNLDILLKAPLACLDFIVRLNFDCVNGFDYIQFDLDDIDLGAGWFQLDDLTIKFTTTDKTVTTDFTVTFGSAVCVKPYFDLNQVGLNVIDGITLQALLLNYSYNGVTIKAGELFAYNVLYNPYVGFTKSGALSTYANCVVTGADEYIGVWYDGDSCCGGLTGASLVTFFDAADGTTGIFDFLRMVANIEVGIGSGFSIRGGLEVSDVGLEALTAGFTFSF